MKRDMQLILKILRYVEEQWSGRAIKVAIEGYTPAQMDYHIRLCAEAKLLRCTYESDTETYWVERLTWAGHDFLDQNRERRTEVGGYAGDPAGPGWPGFPEEDTA